LAVGSLVSNGPSDGTTFEMAFADQLLGISNVVHDATLTGNGTVASPLGIANLGVGTAQLADNAVTSAKIAPNAVGTSDIADGAVTLGKLSATGSLSGKVLTSTGSALAWQSPAGLTLPYTGTDNNANVSFAITNNGAGIAIEGASTGSGLAGVVGAGQNNLLGVAGFSGTGPGVYGASGSYVVFVGSLPSAGVYGISDQGSGIWGQSTQGDGVYGHTQGQNAAGVHGESPNQGVFGVNTQSATDGCLGCPIAGAIGRSHDLSLVGVLGTNLVGGVGVKGQGQTGVWGIAFGDQDTGVYGNSVGGIGVHGASGSDDGVYGYSASSFGVSGVSGSGDGVYGKNSNTNADGCVGCSTAGVIGFAGSTSYAGYFNGKGYFSGVLTKAGGGFKIDHPLDPAHTYLIHSFVESPDMKNVYDGVVTTDADGRAVVQLPDWFETLNRDFRYQLTVIGRFAQAIIEQEIADNRFVIRTNLANVKVSWQVTGIRQDPWANANRLPVEEPKPAKEDGTYLHPDLYGQPEEKSVDWVLNPEMVQRRKADREKARAAAASSATAPK
jgi:hypothetical protein